MTAPHGGSISGLTVQRTYAAAASIEFDGLLVASATAPVADAHPSLDAKAGAPGAHRIDPRVGKLLAEAWRHAKPIGAVGEGIATLETAGLLPSPGICTGTLSDVLALFLDDLALHRVWGRFAASTSP